MQIALSESERQVAVNALHIAIESYRECAASMAKEAGHDRLVKQFEKQCYEAAQLMEKLEG